MPQKVQAKLSSTPAAARKRELTGDGEALSGAELADEVLVVQVTALNFYSSQVCSVPEVLPTRTFS